MRSHDAKNLRKNWISSCFGAPIRRPPLVLALDEFDWRALPDHQRQSLGIPIGQPYATMGLGFTDFSRISCTVDAISFAIQADPTRANGIVRPWLDGEWRVRVHALEVIFWIVVIGRIVADRGDLEFARR